MVLQHCSCPELEEGKLRGRKWGPWGEGGGSVFTICRSFPKRQPHTCERTHPCCAFSRAAMKLLVPKGMQHTWDPC